MKYSIKEMSVPQRTYGRPFGEDLVKFMSFKPGSKQCIVVSGKSARNTFCARASRQGLKVITRKLDGDNYGIWRKS